nr:hypothetical protein OG546_26310 [Streptomyces antimycoticus]
MSPDLTDADRAAPLLDKLALAYAQDPSTVGRLLAAHAVHVTALDLATVRDDATDADRAMCAAEADGTREALLGEIDAPDQLAEVIPLAAARRTPLAQNGHRA